MSGRGRGRARGTGGTRVARGGGRGRGSAGPSAAGTGTRPPPWQLKTVLCDFHERGSCARGETCWYGGKCLLRAAGSLLQHSVECKCSCYLASDKSALDLLARSL